MKRLQDVYKRQILTASTASPYKFAADVLSAFGVSVSDISDYFSIFKKLSEYTNTEIPTPLAELKNKKIRFNSITGKTPSEMYKKIEEFINR